jgi:ABC-type glycerol-3-phosphate transport system substrate-binding protein
VSRRAKVHRIFVVFLVPGIILPLAGCGRRVPSYDEAIVIALGDPSNEAAFKRMAARFKGAHKPIRVELQGAQDYTQWLAIQFIGGKPPPILNIMAPLSWLYGAHEQTLVAFDPYLEQLNPLTGEPWGDQFLPGVLDVCRAPDGRIYVIPFDVVKVAFFYNKSIFRALELEPPATWAEFMDVCRSVDERSEGVLGYHVTPCAVGNSQPSGVVVWNLGTFCDSLFRPKIPELDTRKPDPENPRRSLEPDGFIDEEELTRGYKLGIIDPMGAEFVSVWRLFKDWSQFWVPDFNGMNDMDVRPKFLQQRAAMAMDGSWWCKTLPMDLENLGPGKEFDFGVFPLPPVTDESYPHFHHPFGSLGAVGNGLAVTNVYDQRTVDDSVALVRFFSTPPILLEASQTLNLPTVKGYDLPERYEGFRPLIDGTFPFLKFVERWFPDAQSQDLWFREFQRYLDDRISLDEYRRRTDAITKEGVERAIIQNNYDTSRW